jgi:hypothetical protein
MLRISLPKEISLFYITAKMKSILFVVSICYGWGILCFMNSLMYCDKFKEVYFLGTVEKYKSTLYFIFTIILGFYRIFFFNVNFKGIGYKGVIVKHNLYVKFGYSHRSIICICCNIKLYYIKKRKFKFLGRNIFLLKNFEFEIEHIRNRGVFKKKGIYLRGIIFKIKESSKKAKF